MTFTTFLIVYFIGGLTVLPLLAISLLVFSYFAFSKPAKQYENDARTTSLDLTDGTSEGDGVDEKSQAYQSEPEIAAAYFAVCREYVPGGINGKPPERSTPAGEVLIAESPSVYQSMYRSIFERGKAQIPTIEADKKDGKAVKKARNVFFAVLRYAVALLNQLFITDALLGMVISCSTMTPSSLKSAMLSRLHITP